MTHILTGSEIELRYGNPSSTEDPWNALADCEDALKSHRTRALRGLRSPDVSTAEQRAGLAHGAAAMELAQLKDAYSKRAKLVEQRDKRINEQRRQEADKVSPIVHEERAMPAYDQVSRVTREARTYTAVNAVVGEDREEPRSFFRDTIMAERGDWQARERIARHSRETVIEGEVSTRAAGTSAFAGLVPPQYLVAEAALIARAAGPVANAIRAKGGRTLPDQGMSLILPRETTGSSVAAQATENSTVSATDEAWSNVTVPVVTLAGSAAISRQALERGTPGLDQIVWADLCGAYVSELDRQIINGTGSSGEVLGFRNTASVYQAAAFGAAATTTTFWQKLTGAINSIEAAGNNVGPADLIALHPRRFNWLAQQVDSQGRPIITPTTGGNVSMNAFGTMGAPGVYSGQTEGQPNTAAPLDNFQIKGYLFGVPCVVDANIPTNLGTGSLEDQVAVLSTRHHLLFTTAGSMMPQMVSYEATAATTLTYTMVAYGYAAYSAGRVPLATSLVGGNATTSGFGLTTVTF